MKAANMRWSWAATQTATRLPTTGNSRYSGMSDRAPWDQAGVLVMRSITPKAMAVGVNGELRPFGKFL
jgi:hypothetical protein